MSLNYPEPELRDGVVRLRRWDARDLDSIREAATDSRIPEGMTVPAVYTAEAAQAFIERQWSRVDTGEGVSLARQWD